MHNATVALCAFFFLEAKALVKIFVKKKKKAKDAEARKCLGFKGGGQQFFWPSPLASKLELAWRLRPWPSFFVVFWEGFFEGVQGPPQYVALGSCSLAL